LLGTALAALAMLESAGAGTVRVAAAADLQLALREVAARFEASTGHRVQLSFGSSGNYARQIARGAPFDLYFSANETYVADLVARGLTRGEGDLYGVGRLVLLVAAGRELDPSRSLDALPAAVTDGRLRRFAIANPEHAPYGFAAREALRRAGSWTSLGPVLVFGENAAQATQFVTSGAADAGLVPYALVLAAPDIAPERYRLLPADSHPPLRQRMVLLTGAGPVAEAFRDAVLSADGRAILARHGFAPPGG
jgi:molybdate transport system substrate-binding protein